MVESSDQNNNSSENKKDENPKLPDLSKIIISFEHLAKMQQKLADTIAPVIKRVIEVQQSFQPIFEKLGRFATSINWEELEASIRQRLQRYEEFMSKYDKDCWAITPEMLASFEDREYETNEIEKYVEDHLDNYIMFFQEDPLYARHKSLISEAYELYKNEFYKHCSFSLLAIFENILNSAFSNYKLGNDIKIKNRRPDLHAKTSDFIETNEERLALNILFFRRVYNVYDIIFKPYWDEHPEQINRNWIAHGKYNYERIGKSDILKLFQLLKASSILNEITFEND